MFVYWSMFALPAFFALIPGSRGREVGALQRIGLTLIFVLFVVLIGLRYEVGADWIAYQLMTSLISYETIGGSLAISDPAFAVVCWFATRLGDDFAIYGPAFICGLVLMTGVMRFARQQPDAWLVICASVPYLVVVVGMGYVRQSAAIGLLLIAIVNFERGKLARSFFWAFAASLFHVTALCTIPLAAAAVLRKRPLALIPVVILGAVLFIFLLRPRVQGFLETYVANDFDSSGTLIRLMMNAIPSVLYLIYRNRFAISETARVLWLQFALASVLLIPAVLLSPSTTIVDRLGLYLIPIQLFVFGNLPSVAARTGIGRLVLIYTSVMYYGAVLFIWLNFATHAGAWLPYRFFDHPFA